MAEKLREQHAVHSYNHEHRIPKRSSATQEERDARFQGTVPAPPRQTREDDLVRTTPRSVLRYRPIENVFIIPFTDGTAMRVTEQELGALPQHYQRAAQLITPQRAAPRHQRQPRPLLPEHDANVYDMPPAGTPARATEAIPRQNRRRFHWLFWVGMALVFMTVGWVTFITVAHFWQVTRDDWQYGRPRTFQTDANVGHGTARSPTSHFLALNLNKHIDVIELPGGDARKSKLYVGPTLIGDGQELTPVTLTFADVNKDGMPDMLMHIGDGTFLFLNQRDGTFQAAPNQ